MILSTPARVAVIGGGPAGLIAAQTLADAGVTVSLHDRMSSFGRKLLMAGRGGLNLTHSEALDDFLGRYGAACPVLAPAIAAFPPAALRAWAAGLGQETFVGSSGRVFPRAMKASPLLRAWLTRLRQQGVRFQPSRHWLGWAEDGQLLFRRRDGEIERIAADGVILALGGASWPRLGADGGWVEILAARQIEVTPLRPANCGFILDWSALFGARFQGQPLKNIALTFAGRRQRGEAMVTAAGLEGGAVYALSAALRDAILRDGSATLHVDLCPDLGEDEIARRLAGPRRAQSLGNFLRRAVTLPPIAVHLLREGTGNRLPDRPAALAALIKAVPLTLTAPAPLERAISTAGGIALGELDGQFMLRRLPGVFAAGEMLDWEAPTGGYLLQGCFATGTAAARGALAWLGAKAPDLAPSAVRRPVRLIDPRTA